jgi:hypothetical protein
LVLIHSFKLVNASGVLAADAWHAQPEIVIMPFFLDKKALNLLCAPAALGEPCVEKIKASGLHVFSLVHLILLIHFLSVLPNDPA